MSEFDKKTNELVRQIAEITLEREGVYVVGEEDLEVRKILKDFIEANFIPLSTLKQVIEGMRMGRDDDETRGYDQALSDVLTAITKMEGK